jgi:hypothetical protein
MAAPPLPEQRKNDETPQDPRRHRPDRRPVGRDRAPRPRRHHPAPVQGVGVQLTDTQLINFPTNHLSPWQPEPDTYIGAKNQGAVADPIAAGTTRTYHLKVSNTGNIPETMAAFPAAAAMSAKGIFSWASVSPSAVDAASSWTTVTPAPASLAPGASYTATVTVTVPAGTPAGSYYAVVWAAPQAQAAKPGSITLAIYAGIREYITVS